MSSNSDSVSGPDRRGFVRRLVSLTALGVATSLLVGEQTPKAAAGLAGNVWFDDGSGALAENNQLHWDNANNRLGIGTTTPAMQLEISSASGRMQITSTAKGNNSGFFFRGVEPNGSNYDAGLYFQPAVTGTYPNPFFGISADNSHYQFNVLNNGNVGIGTTTPNAALTFGTGFANNTSMIFLYDGPSDKYGFGFASSLLQIYAGGGAWADTAFGSYDGTTFTERVRFRGNGKVGIGTPTPNASLSLGTGVTTNKLFLYDNTGDKYGFGVQSSLLQIYSGAAGDMAFGGYDGTTFTERVRFTGTGKVGIARAPTANALEVNGNASKTTAGSWLANSDLRIKKDIEDIDDALATISKLHPVRFKYADWYRAKYPIIKDQPYYNFIAQEYQEVFPESVQDDGEGLLQVDTYNVTPYLVRAVQELAEQNGKLAKQNQKLAEQNRTLNGEYVTLAKRLEAVEHKLAS